jgi:hypothetical protein
VIWVIGTAALYIRASRKLRLDPSAPRGMAAWRPNLKALFHAALISGLVVFVGGSVTLFALQFGGQMTTPR